MSTDPQRAWSDKTPRTTLEIPLRDDLDALRDPVLVNLLTGDVFALSFHTDPATGGPLGFDGLPLSDVPMLVCDRSAIVVDPPARSAAHDAGLTGPKVRDGYRTTRTKPSGM